MANRLDAVIGLQWGDEGKGAVADRLSPNYDLTIRPTGSNNAGHTEVVGGRRYVLHQIPAGILRGKTAILGSAMAINPLALLVELQRLEKDGIDTSRLFISDRASLLLPWHIAEDICQEQARRGRKIGTTCKGVGPCYRDDRDRSGLRLHHLARTWPEFRAIIREKLEEKRERLGKLYDSFDPLNSVLADSQFPWGELQDAHERLAPLVVDLPLFLYQRREEEKSILIEGAQGAMLDIRHGTFPFVTSSHPGILGCLEGTGLAPRDLTNVFGIAKAYTTRVGAGPFPSRMPQEVEKLVRKLGKEQGSTTGRDRDCGWLDSVQLRYACRQNGVTGLIVTKIDFLHLLPYLRLCHAYESNGRVIHHVPAELTGVQGLLRELPKWDQSIAEVKSRRELPAECRGYLRLMEEISEAPLVGLSVGPERDDTITV